MALGAASLRALGLLPGSQRATPVRPDFAGTLLAWHLAGCHGVQSKETPVLEPALSDLDEVA